MKTSIQLKRIVTATSFALAVMVGAPVANHYLGFNGFDVISQAYAEDDGGGKGKMGSSGKGSGSKQDKGASDHGGGSTHGKKDVKVTGGIGKGDENRDPLSDRPPTAGVKGGKSGGGGGQPAGAGSKKGDLFGDMVVLIRYPETGLPLTETLLINGVYTVYPLVQAFDAAGNPIVGVSVPRDPATGDLLTKLPDGTPVFTSEVDLGRLSVARAPVKVLEHSLAEAISKLTADGAVVSVDPTGRLVVTLNGVVSTIDSPLENLALYVAAITGTLPASITSLSEFSTAALLAAAADKYGVATLDTVMYINAILKVSPDLTTYTYDRMSTYSDETIQVLKLNPVTGAYDVVTVNLYAEVFNSTNDTIAVGAIDFAQAVDDALQVIEYVHDNEVR